MLSFLKNDPIESRSILDIMKDNDVKSMDYIKKLCKACLVALDKLHSDDRCHGNIQPTNVYFEEEDGIINVKLINSQNMLTQNDYENSRNLLWRAPEINEQNYPKFTQPSDIFSMGLVFYYILTERANPMEIISRMTRDEMKFRMLINMEHLENLSNDSETALFIDLIKIMLQRDPLVRESCVQLIDHAYFADIWSRFAFLERIYNKCGFTFKYWNQKSHFLNQSLIEAINQHSPHLNGYSEIDTNKIIASDFFIRFDINNCSDILRYIIEKKSFDLNDFADTLNLLNKFIKIFPNFLPHMFNIYKGNFKSSSNTVTFKHSVDEVLGEGKIVNEKHERSPIAIKKALTSPTSSRETTLIRKIDHPNVLGCFGTKKADNYSYIGFCECNLMDFITTSRYNYLSEKSSTMKLLQQSAQGLDHLHSLNLIHGCINPKNLLITKTNGFVTLKLSDFETSKSFETGTITGNLHWLAPEIVKATEEKSKSSDIFSLGCVFFFVISGGKSLLEYLKMTYEDITETLIKIGKISKNSQQFIENDLLQKMLQLKPKLRPSTQEILLHPMFWSVIKTIEFLVDVWSKTDRSNPKYYQETKCQLSLYTDFRRKLDLDTSVIKENWKIQLNPILVADLKGYDGMIITELLRAFRNKWTYREDNNEDFKSLFGNSKEPEKFLNYFTNRFPKLIYHVYKSVEESCKSSFKDYFHDASIDVVRVVRIAQDSAKTPQTPEKIIEKFEALEMPRTNGFSLIGKLTVKIDCRKAIVYPENVERFTRLEITGMSNLFFEERTTFLKFIAKNCENVTNLVFEESDLRFNYFHHILQNLPNLWKISFSHAKVEARNENIIESSLKSPKLIELEFLNCSASFIVLKTCRTIRKITIKGESCPDYFDILNNYYRLEELSIDVANLNNFYQEQKKLVQLKVLFMQIKRIASFDQDDLKRFITEQKKLEKFYFSCQGNMDDLFCQNLFDHILQLKNLRFLGITCDFLTNAFYNRSYSLVNRSLNRLSCEVNKHLFFPTDFFELFPNLNELVMLFQSKLSKNLISDYLFAPLNKTELHEVRLYGMPVSLINHVTELAIKSLSVFHITFSSVVNVTKSSRLDLGKFQDFFERCQNIRDLKLDFSGIKQNVNGLLIEDMVGLIRLIMENLNGIERLEILHLEDNHNFGEQHVKRYLLPSSTLKNWKILEFDSDSF